jgi:hypothetical protein
VDIGYLTGSCVRFHDASGSTTTLSVYIHYCQTALLTLLLRLYLIRNFYGKPMEGVLVDLDGDLATAMTLAGYRRPSTLVLYLSFSINLCMGWRYGAG